MGVEPTRILFRSCLTNRGTYKLSRIIAVSVFAIVLTIAAWMFIAAVKHTEFSSTKIATSPDNLQLSLPDPISKLNSSRSALPLKKANARSGCPDVGRTKVATDDKISDLCTNQNKLVVYSKLVNNFPAARFRDYQKSVVDCELPDGVTCLYTEDDSLYSTADVLYIHDCFSFCETPAYPEQIVVRYNLGPELNHRPCNNRTQLADIKVNYHISSTIPWLYLCLSGIKHPLMDALKLDVPSNRHGIAMFVSDCKASFSQWRYEYLQELMKHIEIDSYGKCLHNTPMKPATHNVKRLNLKVDTLKQKRYKFLIAFENSQVSEYITEKIWHAYMSQTIPIYYGAPEIYKQVPGRNTFIDASKFTGPKQLAEYIKKVDRDRKLYQSFFNFDISNLEAFEEAWCSEIPLSCRICNKAYEIKQSRCSISKN